MLADINAGVILASSKTAAEMDPLRKGLSLSDWPAIVENGAGILRSGQRMLDHGKDYARIRETLSQIAAPFQGFGDMSVAQVSNVTGLPPKDAKRAKQRAFSEPGLWQGDDSGLKAFLAALAAKGITARQGGRFLTLSFGQTKENAMAEISKSLNPKTTIALGDAPNDIEMLQAADYGIIVVNPSGTGIPKLAQEETGKIIRTRLAGPVGWNAALLDLLPKLTTKDRHG